MHVPGGVERGHGCKIKVLRKIFAKRSNFMWFVALNTWIPFCEEKTGWGRGCGELKSMQMWNHMLEHGPGERRLL